MSNEKKKKEEAGKKKSEPLSIEELEERLAPSTPNKKAPVPPPYPPGADYGLVKRDNLTW